ncbi:hypothetical protein [Reyranella sp.]|uniref:hypothetical protein n=1 Tax=Reyranella sp. TaxID=1929291 RepID=UPI003BA8E11E
MTRRRIDLAGHPDLATRLRFHDLSFEVAASGTVEVAVGDVHLRFDEIPVHVRIPFLRRRVQAGAIGPFGVHMKPLEGRIRVSEMVTRGVVGGKDSGLDVQVKGDCKGTIEISDDAEPPGKDPPGKDKAAREKSK